MSTGFFLMLPLEVYDPYMYSWILIQISISISSVVLEVFHAGITSIIMCVSRNPSRVQYTKPEIYDVIKEIHPEALRTDV